MSTTLDTARQGLAAHDAAYAARQRHDADVRAHHAARPQPPKGTRPERPAVARPADIAAARELLRRAERADAEAGAAARAVTEARAEVEAAEGNVTNTAAEKARAVHLVAACRRAPGDEARKSVSALGLPDWIEVRYAGEDRGRNEPYVEVAVDGLPWHLASTGRQVLADLHLRLGLRSALGLPALPIAVDNVQAWSGAWPTVPGPSLWLVTAPESP